MSDLKKIIISAKNNCHIITKKAVNNNLNKIVSKKLKIGYDSLPNIIRG